MFFFINIYSKAILVAKFLVWHLLSAIGLSYNYGRCADPFDAEDFQKLIFFLAIIQDCDEAERQRHHLLEPTGHV